MKHIKLFEQYIAIEEVMSQLRTVAKRTVQNLPTIPRRQDEEFSCENFRVVVKRISTADNIIISLLVEVYFDDKNIGTINFDFKSEAPYILVAYEMNHRNEGLSCGQSMKVLID